MKESKRGCFFMKHRVVAVVHRSESSLSHGASTSVSDTADNLVVVVVVLVVVVVVLIVVIVSCSCCV